MPAASARRPKTRGKPQGDHPVKQHRQPGKEATMQPQPLTIAKHYRGSGKLQEKVALITGGDSGIGRSVAVHFAREGADVVLMYLDEHEDARETCRMVEAEGRRCLLLPGDARSERHCRDSVEKVVGELGSIDVLVNHLGVQYPRDKPEDIDRAQLTRTFETNVYPYFYVTQYALPHLGEGSSIINTASVVSFRGHQELIDYAATKGAIRAMTYSLASKLAERGIRVNGVAPGPIWTPLIVSSFDEKQIKEFGKSSLMKRAGQPSEVAPAFVYLACADSSYVTGQFLHVNGGSYIGA
jgi:NAD(P)-dependent dehydrogenase (short-subunit alcohol dehydrogenase family)